MARNFLTPINLNGLELQGAAIGNLSTTSINGITTGTGRIQYDSTLNVLKYRDNTGWQTISTGGGSFNLGSTSISLGSTTTTVAGLSSVTSTTFVGALTGNASTATTLATPRAINGTNFDGSAAITVTAAAGTLTGSTLNSGVTASSLTSVGTLAGLTMGGTLAMGTNSITGTGSIAATTFTGALTGNASTATALATPRAINGTNFDGTAAITITAAAGTLTGTTLASGVTASSLTSVGTLANLTVTNTITGSVSGNAGTATTLATARNINGVSFNGSADITVTAAAGTLSGGTLNSGVTASSLTSVGTLTGLTMGGNIAMGNNKITGLGTPTLDGDAATKLYVDTIATGLHVHPSVNYATTGALGTTGNLVGGTITTTYANGTSGVDATITVATSSNWTDILIDGQSLTVNDRVLIKNQGGTASNLQNGIYFVTQVGAVGNTTSFIFKRVLDADQSPEIDAGDLTYVVAGTVNGGDGYVQNVNNVTVGTTAIQWSQFSGAGAVPLATVTSPGIASFPDAQFSVSAGGAVSIDNLGTLAGTFSTAGAFATTLTSTATTNATLPAGTTTLLATTGSGSSLTFGTGSLSLAGNLTTSGANALTLTTTGTTNVTLPSGTVTLMSTSGNTTGSAATLTTSRTLWGQSFNGSANVTGAITGATTITGTAATAFIAQAADYASTSGQGPHTYIKGGYATAASGTAQGGNVYIWAGGSDSVSGTAGSVNIGSGEAVNITGPATISGVVKLPNVQSGSAGFVKIAATTGQLSTASIAYSDLPTNVGVVARKVSLVGTGSGTTIALTHGLGTNLVTAQVYDTSTSTATLVETDITVTSTVATATFAATTTLSNYTLVVVG